jgi:MFS family permease
LSNLCLVTLYNALTTTFQQMGGAFTDHATWRWCFYVNLPIGGVTAVGILTLLKLPPRAMAQKRSRIQTIKSLDPLGTVVFVPSIVCLLLALEWGGVQYPWSNGRIIALFVIFVIGIVIFIGLQIALGEDATGTLVSQGRRHKTDLKQFLFELPSNVRLHSPQYLVSA